MASLLTCVVEIQTNDGRIAILDESGWRGNDPVLLARLIEEAPIDTAYQDPLKHAANIACYTVGGRIVRTQQRHAGGIGGVLERLRRSLTDSSLQKALTSADDLNQRLGSEQLRNLKLNRLAASAMWSFAGLVLFAAWWYLFI